MQMGVGPNDLPVGGELSGEMSERSREGLEGFGVLSTLCCGRYKGKHPRMDPAMTQ